MRLRNTIGMGLAIALGAAPGAVWGGPEWEEDKLPDAGAFPGDEQVVGKVGGGPLAAIKGELEGLGANPFAGGGDFQDVYRILITEPTLFSATVSSAAFDTQLFLFRDYGGGIIGGLLANDDVSAVSDLSFLPAASNDGSGFAVIDPGEYLLAITGTDSDPTAFGLEIFDMAPGSIEISGPDGPAGGTTTYDAWDADGAVGTYRILLTGCALIPLTPACPADVNRDGAVDFMDLLVVLADWGPCPSCLADVDGDFDVGFGDLLILLAEWGACPPVPAGGAGARGGAPAGTGRGGGGRASSSPSGALLLHP